MLILAPCRRRKMRRDCLITLIFLLFFSACSSQRGRIIFLPDPEFDSPLEQNENIESYEIIESQNGKGDTEIPLWVYYCFNNDVNSIESLTQYNNKYIFIGESQGENFLVLQQWADCFSVDHELPRLLVHRAERRLIASASRYPDDEYGDFYEAFIRKISNEFFPGAIKDRSFWVKRKIVTTGQSDPENPDLPPLPVEFERYEYYILVSINKEILQNQIRILISDVKSSINITREHTAAVNNVQNIFFEGF